MAAISLTYTLTNGTTADASQVMQNFNDIVNGTSDGTKDFSINALTLAGALTANGNVTLGNASGDDLTVNASLASSIPVKTDATYDIGSSSIGLRSIYMGGNSNRVRIMPSGSMSATWTLTLPTTAGTNNYILTTNGSGTSSWTDWATSAWFATNSAGGTLSAAAQNIGGVKTFYDGIKFDEAAGQDTCNYFREDTWTPVLEGSSTAGTGTYGDQAGLYMRLGNTVFISAYISWTSHTGTGNIRLADLPFTAANTQNFAMYTSNLNFSVTPISLGAVTNSGNTKVDLLAFRDADTPVSPTFADAGNDDATPTKVVIIQGWYRTS